MEKKIYERFDGDQVTDDMLQEASKLFSENYGVWSEHAAQLLGRFAKAGSRVRLSKERLRAEYLLDGTSSSYVRVTVNDQLAGHAFACRWTSNNRTVCWTTQLVVHRNYRKRRLAVGLLNVIRQDGDDVYGIMSSHPAACLAATRAFRSSFENIRLDHIRNYANSIMQESPIRYVRDAKLKGSLLDPADSSGLVSSVDSGFFVDHKEPLEALASMQESTDWSLGGLHDGHEFLVILEARRGHDHGFRHVP